MSMCIYMYVHTHMYIHKHTNVRAFTHARIHLVTVTVAQREYSRINNNVLVGGKKV